MLGEEVLEEYIALGEIPTSLTPRDIPIKGLLAFIRVEPSSARIIFLGSGTYVKIPKRWLLFFSGLASWGYDRLPDGFIKDMAELCYGIVSTSVVDPIPVMKLLKSSTEEFRERFEGFEPIEVVKPNLVREL